MDMLPTLQSMLRQHGAIREENNGEFRGLDFQVSEPARPFVSQVYDKFRDADRKLVERLGEANWQRFMRIREREATQQQPSSTPVEIARSVFKPISNFHDSGLGPSLASVSVYAQSFASHSSFLSTQSAPQKGSFRVPSTPAEVAEGKPFVCSLCGRRQTNIHSRIDWK